MLLLSLGGIDKVHHRINYNPRVSMGSNRNSEKKLLMYTLDSGKRGQEKTLKEGNILG